MSPSFLIELTAEALPSTGIMYFIIWLALWGKSYRGKVKYPWIAHSLGLLFTSLIVAIAAFILGNTMLPSTSPIRLFVLPGLLSLITIPVTLDRFRKRVKSEQA